MMKSLRSKILGSFAIILSLLLLLTIYNYIQTNNFKTKVEDALGIELEKLVYWMELNNNLANRTAQVRAYFLYGNEDSIEEFERLTEAGRIVQEDLMARNITAEQEAIFAKTEEWYMSAQGLFEMYQEDPEEAIANAAIIKDLTTELTSDFQGAADESRAYMRSLREQVVETGNTIMFITVLISVIAVAIGVVVAFVLAHKITGPILEIVRRLKKVAEGDLTGDKIVVKTKDEVGQLAKAINDMVSSLRVLIGELLESANNLAASSEEISASTEEIASGSQMQANSASLASEMVKEMVNAIHAVSVNAEESADSSEEMVASAAKGNEVIQDTLQGMNEISEKISELSSKSIQIGEIVEVIDDIAEQTNLLALNAAIEAARAGEAGKGFAVVADEVRKLAERSSKATKEISELIQSIQSNTDASVEAVHNGNEKANHAGKAFEEIISLVKLSANKVGEIAAASEEQNAQSQEVLQSVESIAAVSEQTAAGVQETAATAQDLAKMAEGLSQLAARFRI
ncbi:methyl-accepting chemotaxis protein [Calidifontibacillus oryziterrae]|uniref:methyl-accepting chemotaxis protein n=1 Tax=Calidifontibacillus oryziterrae TaxID=1191699 RepID=UPI00030C3A8C|nr:methyl-accepting chemotaxis protein [Calidifontibacillus oryziterrae]